MNKRFNQVVTSIATGLLLVGVGTSGANAVDITPHSEHTVSADGQTNVGVGFDIPGGSSDNPSGVTPYGAGIPGQVWNINASGRYPFAGSSYGSQMYSNWYFNDLTRYWVHVSNTSGETINVQLKTRFHTFGSFDVAPHSTYATAVWGMSASDPVYLRFASISGRAYSFSGYIQK